MENNIGGNIPESIGHLKKLEFFDASFNNIEGEIPKEFADLPLLWHLQLNRNRLSGPISTKLLQCENGTLGIRQHLYILSRRVMFCFRKIIMYQRTSLKMVRS